MQSFLVLLVSIYVVTANTQPGETAQPKLTSTSTTSPTPNPSSCDAYGNITYNAPDWVRSVSYSCETGSSPNSATVRPTPRVLNGCPLGTPVNVIMYEEAITPATGTLSTARIEKIKLTCSGDQSVYTVSVDFQESDSTLAPLTIKETLTLTMTINAQNGTHSVKKQVVLGHKYDLRVTGAGDNFMSITTCSASRNGVMDDAVLVYEASNPGAHTPAVINSQVTLTGSGIDKHPLKATMTGFRLVGSPTVYLQCNVKVCAHENCNPSRKRKRTKSDIKTASVKFEVIGTHSVRLANGARETNSAGKSVVTIAMVIVATYLSF